MKTDGVKPTIDAVLDKLDKPLPLGYCNAGQVIEIGMALLNFQLVIEWSLTASMLSL